MFSRLLAAMCLIVGSTIASASESDLFQVIDAPVNTISAGPCHMGECVYFKLLSSGAYVNASRDLVVDIREQLAVVPVETRPKSNDWRPAQRFRAVCSYDHPEVSFEYEGEEISHKLSLSPLTSVYGYQVSSAMTYFRACHNFDPTEMGLQYAIIRFGYNVIVD